MKYRRTGISEVKARLCSLLRDVIEGTEIIITDRGRPVARIVPVTEDDLSIEERITRIEALGWVEPPGGEKAKIIPHPFSISGESVLTFLEEVRRV